MCLHHDTTARLDRRKFLRLLLGGSAAGIALLSGCDIFGDDYCEEDCGGGDRNVSVQVGCYSSSYAGYGSSQIGCGLLNTFGDPTFDAQFGQEVQLQGQFFGLPATVYAFNECDRSQKNALSSPQRYILFGYWLAVDTIISTGSTLPIAGILAHEWAHQAQFAFNWMNPNAATARNTELEADAFSGYYMAIAKNWAGSQLNAYFQTLSNLGDYNFNNPGHHGTPQERVQAGALGMQVGYNVLSSGQQISYAELHQLFISQLYQSRGQPSALEDATPAITQTFLSERDQAFIAGVGVGARSVLELEGKAYEEDYRRGFYLSQS
jgi:hypothetical protein